jgi:N-formylglutamate deformylase
MPHIGTEIPADLQDGYTPEALQVEDTDWHLHRLYNFLPAAGRQRAAAALLALRDRPEPPARRCADVPGRVQHRAVPHALFQRRAALPGRPCAPAPEERARRREAYWQPYHSALAAELARLKAQHGFAAVGRAQHPFANPWLFEGKLPDLNIGTAGGASAHEAITAAVVQACDAAPHISTAVNGRFKGGYITRHYGQPAARRACRATGDVPKPLHAGGAALCL